mgnify:CR=1 FL=1
MNEMEPRIIEAAKRVFVRKGYEAATMSDVAAEVGIGRTALHYYYRTKEILFDAIFGQLLSSLLPNIDRVLDEKSTMLEKMPVIVDLYMGIVRANPMFPNFVVGELNRDPERLFQTVLKDPKKIQPILRLRRQIEEEMDKGLLRKMPVIDLVSTLVSLVVFPLLIRKPLAAAFLDNDMGRFEEYSLYAANKSFLLGENVPTFTDLDGRLMALKPDVTLSIAKNTKADKNTCEKVYYLESVYRESKESHTYKEISQMGLECMGGVDDCVIAEVLALALKSLADFETDYVLKISNMDFVVGLMEELPVNADQKDIILGLIRTKNRSGLEKLCADLALPEGDTEKLMKVSGLYGEFGRVLAEAGAIADTPKMKEAVALLSRLYEVLEAMGLGGQLDKVRLDFSMINDIEYYNGIIFQGFLDGLARQVLSGGQYDGMMAKLGKKADAIGFAIYLKELERLPEKSIRYDVDALVLYEPDVDVVRLCQAVESLRRQGLRVRVEKAVPEDLRYCYLYRYDGRLSLEEDRETAFQENGKEGARC